jgi:hypothetical protein
VIAPRYGERDDRHDDEENDIAESLRDTLMTRFSGPDASGGSNDGDRDEDHHDENEPEAERVYPGIGGIEKAHQAGREKVLEDRREEKRRQIPCSASTL